MNKKVLAALSPLLTCLPTASYAADHSDQMVVTGSAVEQNHDFSSIRSQTVVNSQQIQQLQPASVAEALKNEANVTISGGPRAFAQEINVRGLDGSRVLQIIDGARQNINIGRRGGYFIDPELLKKIEIVRGPVGNLYGSGALGGTVILKTKSAHDLLADGQNYGAFLKQGYQSNGDFLKSSAAVYGRQGSIEWLFNGVYSDNHNIRLGDNTPLTYSGSHTKSGLAKLGWQIDDAQHLDLSLRLNEIKATVPVATGSRYNERNDRLMGRNVLIHRKTKAENVILEYTLAPADIAWLDTNALLYWNKNSYVESRVLAKQDDDNVIKTLGFNLKNSAQLPHNIKFNFGTDGYQDRLDTIRDDSKTPGRRPDNLSAKGQTWGVYSNLDIPFNDFISLQSGIRYDYYKNESQKLSKSVSDSAVSPSVALILKPTEWLSFNARYDEAFRAPSLTEMYMTGTHFCNNSGCNKFLANPNLQPEKAKNKELNANFYFSNLLGDDELRFDVSLFRNDVKNFIESKATPLTTQYLNVTKARLTGYETALRYRYALTELRLSYSQTIGKNQTNDAYLEGIPANKLVFDISQGVMDGELRFGTRVSDYAKQDNQAINFMGRKTEVYYGYTLWDIYATWQPTYNGLKGLRVDFAIDNLTDRRYQQAWQALEGQGRNFKLSTSYSF